MIFGRPQLFLEKLKPSVFLKQPIKIKICYSFEILQVKWMRSFVSDVSTWHTLTRTHTSCVQRQTQPDEAAIASNTYTTVMIISHETSCPWATQQPHCLSVKPEEILIFSPQPNFLLLQCGDQFPTAQQWPLFFSLPTLSFTTWQQVLYISSLPLCSELKFPWNVSIFMSIPFHDYHC